MKKPRPPTPSTQSTSADTHDAPSVVVGIGASAGGLKALQQLVAAVPPDSGMAFVVILHLDPARESRMDELLQDRAHVPVTQVTGPTALAANRIYIIPPRQDLAMQGKTLSLRRRGERSQHAPVDLFFRSLAEAYGADAVGIILSGTGADGTAGIRAIREAGGVTMAQSPDEAEYDGMPASAIATGLIDVVLPAAKIPAELIRLRQSAALAETAPTPDTDAALAKVFATLRTKTGHDFSVYKRSTILRRLERRLRFNDVRTLQEYLPVLQSSSSECQALLRDLLISVSSFFRDADAFAALAELTPALFEGKGPNDTVRVWVVGSATGEEAYSIAMTLVEHAASLVDPPQIQLFATDIDEHAYASARAGLFTEGAVAGITPARLRRFFSKEPGGYRIAKSLRELVLFAGHNVLHDPPFSRIDLISCRNLFIYLQPETQDRVLETFHFAANPGGLLFLGASESVGERGLFVAIPGCQERLFRRNAAVPRATPRLSAADPLPGTGRESAAPEPASPRFSYGALHLRMLEQYTPASLIVDERLNVVHLSADAGRYLRLNEGEPSHNLLGLARENLRRTLRTALHDALTGGEAATRRVSLDIDGARRPVIVHVRPSNHNGDLGGKFALIVFEVAQDEEPAPATPPGEGERQAAEIALEQELRRTKELLESSSTAHERAVAELQTLNEELQSTNEEQKAAAEELETGREEIQSINEELTTINQEHQSTIEELKRTNADLQNLIESTEIGTIFLDRTMRIRRFTPEVAGIFNVVPADQGRPLSDITHVLNYPALMGDVAGVLDSLERLEREVRSDGGESYIVRISPYRSLGGSTDGVVLTFFDNTAQNQIRNELEKARIAAESANLAKGTFLSTLTHEFRTPLNGILGYADLLELDRELTPTQSQRVARIKAGCWHLATMIEEILDYAKLDGHQQTVQVNNLDARAVAREAAALVEGTVTAKGLTLVLDVPDSPVPIVTDGAKARQVLVNLCGNAVKYTEAGEIRLRVRSATGRVIFEVHDNGIGIAPEYHARIFERFWQVDGSATRTASGMGIGLAAAREYARLLGGDVQVESELGIGSTFNLWLPSES